VMALNVREEEKNRGAERRETKRKKGREKI
jgi:hypothetical protein